jgi:hypothetical protein
VCKLDSWAHVLWAFGLAIKQGVTVWYQSRVDRRNANLVRRVIFWRLFYNQNYFYSILSKIFISLLILKHYLALLSPLPWKEVLLTFFKSSQKFWHLQVYIFTSKHLNEVWRHNEGPAKDEASLSSRLEDTFGWRDEIVAPSSPPRKMATCAPPVYVIPHKDAD